MRRVCTRRAITAAALAVLLGVLFQPPARAGQVIDRIVATVNGHIILQSDWDDALRYEALLNGRPLDQFTDDDRRACPRPPDRSGTAGGADEVGIVPACLGGGSSGPRCQTRASNMRKRSTDEGWQAVLARFGLAEKDLVSHVQQQIDLMRLVDAHLRPAVQIDSKTIEAYYREKFVPQLKQPVRRSALGRRLRQDPRIAHRRESQRADGFLAAVVALRKQSQRPRREWGRRGGSAIAVTEPAARPPRWWKYLMIAAGIGLLALLAGLWYTTTDSFQAYVRRRMVEEVERITGGRAEIGSFHVVPFHLQVEVRNITVHGKEPPTEAPLVHADSLLAQVKVISFLRTEFGFYSVVLDHPVVHIAIGPDGTTNIPAPREARKPSENTPIEQLFALSIDHLSVRNGELLWADRKIALDFSVHDTGLQMDYSFLRARYDSHLALGKVDSSVENLRPFSWNTSVDFSLGTTFADVKAFKWNSGRSSVEASGRISDFRNPHLNGSYDCPL